MKSITTSLDATVYSGDGAGLQAAIDAVSESNNGEGGGTVWVWGDDEIALNTSIYFKSNVMVDFQGSTLRLASPEIGLRIGSPSSRIHVCNLRVSAHVDQTAPILSIDASQSGGSEITQCSLTDIRLEGVHGTADAIEVVAAPGSVRRLLVQNIRARSVRHLLLLRIAARATEAEEATGGIEDNFFYNLSATNFTSLVFFHHTSTSRRAFTRNTFEHVTGQANSSTLGGFLNVRGDANHFDHCSVDWSQVNAVGRLDFHLSQQAGDTYVCSHGTPAALDLGMGSIFDPPSRGELRDRRRHRDHARRNARRSM